MKTTTSLMIHHHTLKVECHLAQTLAASSNRGDKPFDISFHSTKIFFVSKMTYNRCSAQFNDNKFPEYFSAKMLAEFSIAARLRTLHLCNPPHTHPSNGAKKCAIYWESNVRRKKSHCTKANTHIHTQLAKEWYLNLLRQSPFEFLSCWNDKIFNIFNFVLRCFSRFPSVTIFFSEFVLCLL